MAVSNEDNLKNDIKSGSFAPVYIFFGDDAYLKKHYVDKISQKVCGKDNILDYQVFERDTDLQLVFDAKNQFPMISEKKCILLSDFDYLKASADEYNRLCDLLSDASNDTVLILRFDGVEFDSKNTKAKKLISSAEKCGGKAIDFSFRNASSLVKMIIDGAASRGLTVKPDTARYIVETVGSDINTLRNELNKLCCFLTKGEITKETVELVCTKSLEASIYDFTREIISCNSSNALRVLDNLFFMRIEPLVILSTVSCAFVDMYRVLAGERSQVPVSTVSNDFEYKNRSFLLDKAKRNLQRIDVKRLSLCFDELLIADKMLKSYLSDAKPLFEQLTIKLIYIISRGETVDKA